MAVFGYTNRHLTVSLSLNARDGRIVALAPTENAKRRCAAPHRARDTEWTYGFLVPAAASAVFAAAGASAAFGSAAGLSDFAFR